MTIELDPSLQTLQKILQILNGSKSDGVYKILDYVSNL